MKKEKFLQLVSKLKGLNYCFFSGFVMFILTNGKRKFNDIDILVDEKDIDILAKRFGVNAEEKEVEKNNNLIKGYGFETNFLGFSLEVVTNSKNNKKEQKHVQLILKNKVKKHYLGEDIFIEPLEEMIARKAFLHRDKDIADLEILKSQKIDLDLLEQFAKNWGKKEEIMGLIKKIGFDLK